MPIQENLNVSPYYADYTPVSDYYSILYKAGFPIQARELTNMQLMQQNQLEQFMSRFLKNGDTVVPGEYAYRVSAYARMAEITQGATAAEFVGYKLTGTVSGVVATVNHATPETEADDITFYVNYETSGNTSEYETFIEGETLESDTPNRYTAVVGVSGVSKPLAVYVLGQLQECPALGRGSLFTVEEGSYFVDGIAVRNDRQTIELEKYSTLPSYQVGFNVVEQFITSNDDPALLDNAQGSSNFAAPGADRLKLSLILAKTTNEAIVDNFIQIVTLLQGNIVKEPTKQQNWNWLYDILAKRTMDESGNYIITDFPVELLEYWNTEDVNGLYNADVDGLYPPVPGSQETNPMTFQEADSYYVLKLSPGEAYVQGFNVAIDQPVYLYGKKPRTQSFRPNAIVPITTPFDLKLTNVYNAPSFSNTTAEVDTVAFSGVTLYRNFNDGYVGESLDATGEPINAGSPPPRTFHVTVDGTDITPGDITEPGVSTVIYADGKGAVVTCPSDKIVARYNGTPADGTGDVINQIGGQNVLVAVEIDPAPAGIIYPRYLEPKNIIESRIDVGSGNTMAVASFDSTYDMGVIKSEFFTQLVIIQDDLDNQYDVDWVQGDQVIGEKSGTFGTVVADSSPSLLIVSNIVGEFEPGEFVKQKLADGSEKIGRIAKTGDPIGFEFTHSAVPDLSGVTSIELQAQGSTKTLAQTTDFTHDAIANKIVLTPAGREIIRNFPYPEGSALQKSRINVVAVATSGGDTTTGYVVTIPAKTENSFSKTKSFFSFLADTTNFSADMAIENNLETDILRVAAGSIFSGAKDGTTLVCNDFGGDPSQQLQFGDLITFFDSDGNQQSHLVYFATEPVGYGQNRVSSVIYLTTPLVADVNSAVVSRVRIKPKGQPNNNLLFQLPQETVASLESDPDATGINYYVLQEFVNAIPAGSTFITLETNKANEQFIQGAADTIVTVTDSDGTEELGRQLTVVSANVTDLGRKITLTFSDPADPTPIKDNATLKIILPVYVSNAKAKRKIKKTQTIVVTGDLALEPIISLGVADGIAVTEMTMAPNDIDVRDNYDFDDGQRDNFYGISTLELKDGAPPATDTLSITFDYFDHSGDGDFFSVDSYISDGGVNYADIPVYAPIAGIPLSESTIDLYVQLRDCVDFRPIVNTAGANPSYLPSITPGKGALEATNFRNSSNDGNGIAPRIPVTGSNFECNLAFYQAKIDALFMEKSGAITIVEGATADEPIAPPDIATGIRLYDFKLSPYTFNIKGIKTNKFNYKSYQMKDIVSLERRIGRLEELVSLSLLEQSALNMNVRDAVTGLDRFKNGMVVDNFSTHGQGATGSEYYRCSIDEIATHLRAPHYTDQVELIEVAQNQASRVPNGYRKAGPQLMLDYSEGVFTTQPFATRSVNLQPYTVFCYDGEVELSPAIDTWTDTSQQPDLVIRDNSLFDSMVNLTQEMTRAGMGTVWGDWQDTGRVRTDVNRTNTPQDAGRGPGTANNWNPAVEVTTTTRSVQQARTQTRTDIRVSTGRRQETSYGDRITDVSLARTMRTRQVRVEAARLKPNTRYYIYFDDVDCTEWFAVDNQRGGRYRSTPGVNSQGFGYPIMSDNVGTVAGIFVIPNGRPPVPEQPYNGMARISYQTSGPTRSFNNGTRKFRITTSKTNSQDLEVVEGFAETTYTASGVLQDKQETIVATTIPAFSRTRSVTQTENRWQPGGTTVAARVIGPPPAPRIIERTERVVVERTVVQRVETPVFWNWNDDDPIAQTFTIDSNEYPDGMFLSEVGVYFETKDPTQAVECYITTTDGEVPTDTILPYSIAVKQSNTTLRVKCELGVGVTSTTIPAGTTFTGSVTGSTGVLQEAITFSAASKNTNQNVSNTVYDLVFVNYVGDFVTGEELTPNTTPAQTSTFNIVEDEINIEYAEVTDVGQNYSSGATVTFTAPQLPGGVTATGTVRVGAVGSTGEGRVYGIDITNSGSGYTKIPSATVSDTSGSNATVAVRTSEGEKAVDMGVATSEDATAETRFRFQTPIYLLGDTTYSFVLKAPTSLKYKAYTAKIGENEIGTTRRVTKVASLGSLFKSQNGGLWTADQTQDIKFNLSRAIFIRNTVGRIDMVNAPIEGRLLDKNPIRTSNNSLVSGSTQFGANPKIVQIHCMWHSLLPGDLVAITGVSGEVGGIPDNELNTLHTVIDAGLNDFSIQVSTDATAKSRGGGSGVKITTNKEYECINITTGAMTFGSTTLTATTTPAIGLSVDQAIRVQTSSSPLALELSRNKYTKETSYDIELLETYYFNGVKTVVNEINEAFFNDSQRLNEQKSLEVAVFLLSTSDAVSPVINLERTNANVIRNLVNNPNPSDPIFGVQKATLKLAGNATALGLTNNTDLEWTSGDGVTRTANIDNFDSATGRIQLRGDHVRHLKNAPVFSNSDINLMTAEIDVADGDLYYPEVNNRGSAWSKFQSKLFIFESECDGIQLKLSACYYTKDSIRCFYRPRAVGFDGNLSGRNWIPFNPEQELIARVVDSNQQNQLIENRQIVPGLPDDVNLITVRDSDNVNPAEIGPAGFKSLVWTAQDLPKFDALAIKIVMVVENPALTPIIDDMQLVVTE